MAEVHTSHPSSTDAPASASGTPPVVALQHLLKRPLSAMAAFSLALNLLLLVPAIFMMQVFDRVLVSRSGATLLLLVLGVGLALLLMLLLDHVRARLQGLVGQMVADVLTPAVTSIALAQVPGAPAGRALSGDRGETGSGTAALRDVQTLRAALTSPGLMAFFDAPWLLAYGSIITWAHPWLGAAALAAGLSMLGLAWLNSRLSRSGLMATQQESAAAQRWIEQGLQNAEVVQTLGMSPSLIDRWHTLNGRAASVQWPVASRTTALTALARTLRQGIQVAMLALGAWLVITQQASPGVMIATTILLGRALAPLEQIVAGWRVLAEGRLAWQRLCRLLNSRRADDERMPLPSPEGHLTLQGVALRAGGGAQRWLLSGVSLELLPGQSLAVVGPSGAGKSTLARVLTGLWAPTLGSVRLDRADLALWPRDALGPHIGYVPQDVELFACTVAENIARLGPVDPQAVVEAAKRARVHELIHALPNGYDTVLEPQGTVVTPGQRQRIALARALYGQPRLLVLDEPNANLDGAGELALAEVLASLRGQVTVVIITHRTHLVQHVDRMLVLDGGRVLQEGPVADVLARLDAAGATRPATAASAQVVALKRAADAPHGVQRHSEGGGA